jgi:hypothetical protein
MISRSTLVGALVVTELVIVAAAGRAMGGAGPAYAPGSMPGTHTHFGIVFHDPVRRREAAAVTTTLDRTFAAGLTPHVVIDVSDVPVTVQAGSVPAVHVVGTVRKSGFRDAEAGAIAAVQTADGVRVTAGDTSDVHGSFERTLRLTVPPGAVVEVASGGALAASGLRGKLMARVDGAVHVGNQRGDVDVMTSTGDVELVDVQADAIVAHSGDGHLKLTAVGADHVDAHTESGDIAASDLRAVDGRLATMEGTVGVMFAANSDANVNLHTDDGSITGAGAAADTTDDAQSRMVRLGSARGSFTVSTGSGSITVSQGANV